MNIYLLRHGLAVEGGPEAQGDDALRPLAPEGRAQLQNIARAMKKMRLEFDCLLSSPFTRARQTAELIAEELQSKSRPVWCDELKPAGSAEKLISEIRRLRPVPENILLVGHEPYLSRLIARLVTGEEKATIEIKKAGLCKLEAADLRPGRCAQLHWLLTPAQMEGMI